MLLLLLAVICSGLSVAAPESKPAELSVVSPFFHEYEDGPALSGTYAYKPGESVFLSFKIAGFKVEGEEDDQIRLAYSVRTVDGGGRLVAEPKEGKIETSLAPEDKKSHWLPIVRYAVQLPPEAASGNYLINISVEDLVAKTTFTKSIGFNVGTGALQSTTGLEVKNVRFYRGENESDALPPEGSYRRGDPIWIRFDISGYRFGEKNKYDVKYGVKLADPGGKVILEKPEIAHESEESFYPRQFLPEALNFTLDSKAPAGTYTATIHLEDAISGESIDSVQNFRLE